MRNAFKRTLNLALFQDNTHKYSFAASQDVS